MYERARRSNGKFEGIIPSVCSGPGGWRPGGAWPGGGRRWGRRRLPGWSRGPPGTPGRLREGRGGFTWTISMPLVLSSKESILNGVLVGECFNRVASLDFSNIFSAWIALLTLFSLSSSSDGHWWTGAEVAPGDDSPVSEGSWSVIGHPSSAPLLSLADPLLSKRPRLRWRQYNKLGRQFGNFHKLE